MEHLSSKQKGDLPESTLPILCTKYFNTSNMASVSLSTELLVDKKFVQIVKQFQYLNDTLQELQGENFDNKFLVQSNAYEAII